MSYIYENDVSRVGGNLQKTVAYLLSLHKNEYEWNMLGIKVVGHIDALPIPDGKYEYGDAYMIGSETPYDMYVYTRADAYHSNDYWFDIGKFPQPGAPGPAGPSLINVTTMEVKTPGNVTYSEEDGATIEYYGTEFEYLDPNTEETKTDTIDTTSINLPIAPGKYISMDADSTDVKLEIKVDDTELAQDFYKVDKTDVSVITVPVCNKGVVEKRVAASTDTANAIVLRDTTGSARFYSINTYNIKNAPGSRTIPFDKLWYTCGLDAVDVTKTTTDTGTLSTSQMTYIQTNGAYKINYDGQLYYRMDPTTAPDGTLTFIHIDTLQNGNSGYKATGKAFSITVSTRAWQVVNLDFGGGSTLYSHHIMIHTNAGDRWFIDTVDSHGQYTESNEIGAVHLDPMNAYFAEADATMQYTPVRVTFTDDGNMQVISADNTVNETVQNNNLTVSDQVQLI